MATPNAMTWNAFVTQLANMAVVNTTTVSGLVQATSDAAWFNTLLPQCVNYAELRIQRDVDLLSLLVSRSYTLTAGSNALSIPVADFVTIQTIGLVVGTVLQPLLPTSKEYIQNVWPDSSATAPPQNFAMVGGDVATYGNTSMNLLFGPYPDQNYSIGVIGTTRAASLYTTDPTAAGTITTFISTWLPDLMLQAAMIEISQYQREFSATSNDPEMPASYESAYQNLLKGAIVEEARRKWMAPAWSSESPPLIASESRGGP